jgi:3-oxoacyl-[acyl-carrier-protein] synthase II
MTTLLEAALGSTKFRNAKTTTRDRHDRPIVVVTGMGVITSLGEGKTENWTKITAGESGISTIRRFSTHGLKTRIAGTIDFVEVKSFSSTTLAERLADIVIEEAIGQSEIGRQGDFPGPLFLGLAPVEVEWLQREEIARAAGEAGSIDYDILMRTSSGERFTQVHARYLFGSVADHLCEAFGTKGSPISVSTACASGQQRASRPFGAEKPTPRFASQPTVAMVRFSLLSALSTHNDDPRSASKPFSKNRQGFVMAEGAGALVLESLDAAQSRGAKILGVIAGCGELADTFHRTRPKPDGIPIADCIRNALADASMSFDQIDYINAHGTSTPENDKMEYLGAAAVLGDHARKIPVSSNKSMIGHTLSAAGIIETVFILLEHQRLPPTINYDVPDPAIPFDVVPNKARDARVATAMSNSFGFGGQNVSLIIRREPG